MDNHYGKFIHDNIWYTDAYIHSDNHIYTSPSHADSHSHLHIQMHAHLKTHIRPYPHVQDSYFHTEHEYKSYCQKKYIYIYIYCLLHRQVIIIIVINNLICTPRIHDWYCADIFG